MKTKKKEKVFMMPETTKVARREDAVNITPEMAQKWLETMNTINRPIRKGHVERLTDDVTNGKFLYTRDPIRFDWNGVLLDGQYRLTACMIAGKPIVCDVIWDLDPALRDVIDTGLKRTAGDIAAMRGASNPRAASSAAALLIPYYRRKEHRTLGVSAGQNSREIAQWVMDHPDLQAAVEEVPPLKILQRSLAIACFYLFSHQDAERTEMFFAALREGASLAEDDPVLILRNKLIALSTQRTKERPYVIASYVFKAWIAFRDKAPLKPSALRYVSHDRFPDLDLGWSQEEQQPAEVV